MQAPILGFTFGAPIAATTNFRQRLCLYTSKPRLIKRSLHSQLSSYTTKLGPDLLARAFEQEVLPSLLEPALSTQERLDTQREALCPSGVVVLECLAFARSANERMVAFFLAPRAAAFRRTFSTAEVTKLLSGWGTGTPKTDFWRFRSRSSGFSWVAADTHFSRRQRNSASGMESPRRLR